MKFRAKSHLCLVLSCLALFAGLALAADEKAQTQPANQTDLKLFNKDATWKFVKNTGDGSFELSTGGDKPIGILNYDFSKKVGSKTPYVLAETAVNIPDTAAKFQLSIRSATPHRVTLRFIDSTGQTLQVKGSVKGDNTWQVITLSLAKKMEHWDGANDGKVHFPIKSLSLSIPQQNDDDKSGKIEFSDAATLPK